MSYLTVCLSGQLTNSVNKTLKYILKNISKHESDLKFFLTSWILQILLFNDIHN